MGKELHPTHGEDYPPLLGRIFHLRLRPANRLTWVGAGWAAVCGMATVGPLHPRLDVAVRVLLTLVLVDPVLGAVWTTLYDMRDASRRQPDDPAQDAVPDGNVEQSAGAGPPQNLVLEPTPTSFWASMSAGFDEPASLRAALAQLVPSLRRVSTWWRSALAWWSHLATAHRQRFAEAGALYGLALLLALSLGPGVAVVVTLGLLLPLVVWFALGGYPLRDSWTRAVLEIGIPWMAGLAAFAALPVGHLDGMSGLVLSVVSWAGSHAPSLAVGFLFAVAYYGKLTLDQSVRGIGRAAFVTLPQAAAVALLAAWGQPLLAGAAAILVLGQMLFQPYLRRHHMRWYLHTTQWMFMAVMLIAAVGVAAARN